MTTPDRRGISRPRHSELVNTHEVLRNALREEQGRRDVQQMVELLTREYSEDADGLHDLLNNLGVTTPGELLEAMRMFTLSASYTALTWAGGMAVEGERFESSDVLNTSWAQVE